MGAGVGAARKQDASTGSESSRWWRAAALPLYDLLTTVVPADCRVCEEPLVRSGRLPVCAACLAAPEPLGGVRCFRCDDLLGFEAEGAAARLRPEERLCTPCRMAPPEFERAVATATYDAEMREMLHLLKYGGLRALARPLGERLAASIAELAAEWGGAEVLLVPVPLFRDRRRERGFNQATELAVAAQKALRRTRPELRMRLDPELLSRKRATRAQFELTPAQRRRNVRGAFVAPAGGLRGRTVLLIDDIFTTGATARACAGALRRGGAEKVWVATVARAEPEMVTLWDGGGGP